MPDKTTDLKAEPRRAEEYVTRYLIATKNGVPCGMYNNEYIAREIAKEIDGSLFFIGSITDGALTLTLLGRYSGHKFIEVENNA